MTDIPYVLLGTGTYGCVIKPPLGDVVGRDDASLLVGKIMEENEKYAEDELHAARKLQRIDPSQHYFLYPLRMSKVCIQDIAQCPWAKRCKFLQGKPMDLEVPQLLMRYGGRTLQRYLNKLQLQGTLLTRSQLLQLLKPLFYGVECLIEHRMAHQDIKINNIVVQGHEARLIDFGLLADEHSFYTRENILWDNQRYAVNPPEYRMLCRVDLDKVTESELMMEERIIMMDYTNAYHKMDKLWYNYYGIGNVIYHASMKKLQHGLHTASTMEERIALLKRMQCFEKCDLYALGFLLFQLSTYLVPPHQDHKKAVRMYKLLVHGLLNPCPEDRLDVEQVFAYLETIVSIEWPCENSLKENEEGLDTDAASSVSEVCDEPRDTPQELGED